MAVLNPNEIFFTAFEPKVANRFIMYMDGIPSYIVKEVSDITIEQGEIKLNHINVYRKVKGRAAWGDITMTLFDRNQNNHLYLLQIRDSNVPIPLLLEQLMV